jgi:hypothetical protein
VIGFKFALALCVTPYSLVDKFQRFARTFYFCRRSCNLQTEAASVLQTVVLAYGATRCHIAKDNNLDFFVRNLQLIQAADVSNPRT